MLITSITWIIWSQTSGSSAAVFERTSAEIKYAYLLNGIFILTAVIGIILDSCRQARKYFQRSLALNREVSIEEFKDTADANDTGRTQDALVVCKTLDSEFQDELLENAGKERFLEFKEGYVGYRESYGERYESCARPREDKEDFEQSSDQYEEDYEQYTEDSMDFIDDAVFVQIDQDSGGGTGVWFHESALLIGNDLRILQSMQETCI